MDTSTQTTVTNQPQVPEANQPLAKMQAYVTFIQGTVSIGEKFGILEWSADDRIRLFEVDRTTQQVMGTTFDVSLTDIAKIGGMNSFFTIRLSNGSKYTVNFSTASAVAFASAGLVGMIGASAINKQSGLYNWLDAFRSRGVNVRYIGMGKLLGITFAGAFGLVVVIVIIAIIASQSGG